MDWLIGTLPKDFLKIDLNHQHNRRLATGKTRNLPCLDFNPKLKTKYVQVRTNPLLNEIIFPEELPSSNW